MFDLIFSTSSGVTSIPSCASLACSATYFISSSSVSAVADQLQSAPTSAQLILFDIERVDQGEFN